MRRLIVLLAVLTVGLLPACAQQSSAQELVAASASKTQDAGSAKMMMTMTATGGPQEMKIDAEGAFDFESQRGSMTMDLGALGGQAGMGEIEMRTDGTTIYMRMPEQMGLPTPWVKMDIDTMTGTQGLGQLSQFNNNDPTKTMDMLQGVSDDVEEVGTEDVRGTPTTHYKATIDLEKAIESASEDVKQALQQQLDTLGATTLPTEVWIDEDGLLRRQTFTIDMSQMEGAGGGQAPGSMTVLMELYDFGAEVDVEPPPADQVTDMADLQG